MATIYLILQTVFLVLAVANMLRGAAAGYDLLILSLLMAILYKMEGKRWH